MRPVFENWPVDWQDLARRALFLAVYSELPAAILLTDG